MKHSVCISLRSLRPFTALSLIAVLAACGSAVPAPRQQPVTSTPAPRPAPVQTAPQRFDNWADAPATQGTWRHRLAGRDSIADFVGTGGQHLFQLTCSADRDLTLARIGPARSAVAMTIRTRTSERTVSASAMENSVVTALPARDPLLGAMAYSRGRFAVEVEGMPTLFLPSWPEVTRVIDDCQ